MSNGLYMTEEQYLALDEASDGKYERLNGMVTMLRPPSSLYGADESLIDMAAALMPTRPSACAWVCCWAINWRTRHVWFIPVIDG